MVSKRSRKTDESRKRRDAIIVPEDGPHVNEIGVKGIGEIGIVGVAAAIANARVSRDGQTHSRFADHARSSEDAHVTLPSGLYRSRFSRHACGPDEATRARGLVASTQKGLQQQNSVEGDANAGSDVCSRE